MGASATVQMYITSAYTASQLRLLSVSETKVYLRISPDITTFDGLVLGYITDAHRWAERETNRLIGRSCVVQEFCAVDGLLSIYGIWLQLKYGTVSSVSEVFVRCSGGDWMSVYTDVLGVSAGWSLDIRSQSPAYIRVQGPDKFDELRVIYECGEDNGGDIPSEMIQSMLRYIWACHNPTDIGGFSAALKTIQKLKIGRYGC